MLETKFFSKIGLTFSCKGSHVKSFFGEKEIAGELFIKTYAEEALKKSEKVYTASQRFFSEYYRKPKD
jgi:hypothetical protein